MTTNYEQLYEAWKRDVTDLRPAHEALGMEWEEFHEWTTERLSRKESA